MRKPPDPLFADAVLRQGRPGIDTMLQAAVWMIGNSAQPTAILDLDLPDAPVVHANPAFVRLTGATAAEAIVGRTLPELLGIDSAGADWLALQRRLTGGLPAQLHCLAHGLTHESFRAHIECHVMARPPSDAGNTDAVTAAITAVAAPTAMAAELGLGSPADASLLNGQHGGLAMAIVLDRSADWLASQQQLTQTGRLDSLLAAIDDAVVQVDSAMVLNAINPAAELLTGWSETAAKGLPAGDVVRFIDRLTGEPVGSPLLAALLSGEETGWVHSAAICRPDGSQIPVIYRTAVVRNVDGMVVEALLLVRDHSDASVMTKAIAHSAWHDPLTGLPNRSVFEDRLSQAHALTNRHKHRFGLLLVDVDGVDRLIEAQGHASSQDLIKALAENLRKVFRRCDTVCRIGDFRFAVVLPVLDAMASETLLEAKAFGAVTRLAPFTTDSVPLSLRVAAAISQEVAGTAPSAQIEAVEAITQRAADRLLTQN